MKRIEQLLSWLTVLFYPIAIYYWVTWSKIYRWFHNSAYAGINIRNDLTPQDAQRLMDTLPWEADSWEQLWDVAGNPEKFQRDLSVKLLTGILATGPRDCDDFAGWAAVAVDKSYKPKIMATWYKVPGVLFPRGHVVCYVEINGDGYHIGNWGMRGPVINSYQAVAYTVAGEKDADLLAFAILDKNLKVESVERVRWPML